MFVVKCALNKLRYSKKISLIFILSIAAGLLCPVYVLGYIHTSMATIEMNRYRSPEDFVLVDSSMPVMDSAALASMERIMKVPLEDYECTYQTTVNWEDVDGVAFVGGVSAGILERVPVFLKEGRLFEASDYEAGSEPVCLLTSDNPLRLSGADVGDTVSFMGNGYTVAGIIDGRDLKLISSILVPYPAMADVSGVSSVQHRFIVPNTVSEESIRAQTQMMFDVSIYSVRSLVEEEAAADAIFARQNRDRMLVGLVVCLFAC